MNRLFNPSKGSQANHTGDRALLYILLGPSVAQTQEIKQLFSEEFQRAMDGEPEAHRESAIVAALSAVWMAGRKLGIEENRR